MNGKVAMAGRDGIIKVSYLTVLFFSFLKGKGADLNVILDIVRHVQSNDNQL